MPRTAFSADTGVERLRGFALVALVLLPLLIGGILSWGLSTPTQNLDRVTAAVVNDDTPVTVNGTTVPLGRQFAAGLIAGTTNADAQQAPPNNFSWILTNDDEAKSGLASGRYAAVVTIPSDFSAKATSISGPAADAAQALLKVETSAAASSSTRVDRGRHPGGDCITRPAAHHAVPRQHLQRVQQHQPADRPGRDRSSECGVGGCIGLGGGGVAGERNGGPL